MAWGSVSRFTHGEVQAWILPNINSYSILAFLIGDEAKTRLHDDTQQLRYGLAKLNDHHLCKCLVPYLHEGGPQI